MGFEPMIRVLQTLALPLGHVARNAFILSNSQGTVKESGVFCDILRETFIEA